MEVSTVYTPLPYEELRRLLIETASDPVITIDDRETWDLLRATAAGKAVWDAARSDAEELGRIPNIPAPTLSQFLAFSRTGDRQTWEAIADRFAHRMDAFSLTACFTGEMQWVEKAADALWAMCEMTTWVTPAHENLGIPDPDNPTVELWSGMWAQEIAETVRTLQPALDRIDPRITRRIRRELDRRIFTPFLARGDWWWLFPQQNHPLNNWTAVCSGTILCAALALLDDEPERQAQIVHKAAWSLTFFKDIFGAMGSLDEGVGYWSYGMGYFVMAAERLHNRTKGKANLLSDSIWGDIAAFPLGARLYGDTFVNFSDCAPHVTPSPGWLFWLGRQRDIPEIQEWALSIVEQFPGFPDRHRYFPFVLRNLLLFADLAREGQQTRAASLPSSPSRPLATYLPDVQWMVARADASVDALVVAVKGGHNAENHNHNDGGSFIVHAWQEPCIAELGAPTYTRQFFSDTRYENIAARSLGHSVPFVNGAEQQPGHEFAARNVRYESDRVTDTLTQDLAGFYGPEAKLASLIRCVSLCRGTTDCPGICVTLSDHATFIEDGCTLALPIITLDRIVQVVEPGRAEIIGTRGKLTLTWDSTQATCRAEAVPTVDVKFLNPDGTTRIHRLWFGITVIGKEGRIQLAIQADE